MDAMVSVPEPDLAELRATRPHLGIDPVAGLTLEDVPLAAIARSFGTPAWIYGAGTMRARARAFRAAFAACGLAPDIHFAVKANDHQAVLRLFAAEGLGADVVSGGELARARAAGMAATDIVFSGVGKTVAELDRALAEGVGQINVESAEELEMLAARARAAGRPAPVVLRVNPDVDAATHAKITTGRAENKFGIALAEAETVYARAARLEGITLRGLAFHIGSQITDLAAFRAACTRIADLAQALRGRGLALDTVDFGGGLGISYRGEAVVGVDAYAGAIAATLGGLGARLKTEPGRWLVGPAGVLLAAVVLVKETPGRRFVVLDAAMNDLLRPALYEAWHAMLPVAPARGPAGPVDVVGPVCESADRFAVGRMLPPLGPGALVAILDAGAYGAVMSSTYNSRPLLPVVMIERGRFALVRARQPEGALWAGERVPEWFG